MLTDAQDRGDFHTAHAIEQELRRRSQEGRGYADGINRGAS